MRIGMQASNSTESTECLIVLIPLSSADRFSWMWHMRFLRGRDEEENHIQKKGPFVHNIVFGRSRVDDDGDDDVECYVTACDG